MVNRILVAALAGLASAGVVERATCGNAWDQCGGVQFTGSTCCQSGNVCVEQSEYYSQCTPSTSSVSGATAAAPTFSGSTVYTTSIAIDTVTYTQSAYPAETSGACGAWTVVDNVCCPSYCTNDDTSSSCGGTGCTCGTPPSGVCKSGTMWGETTSVGTSETWHYSRSTHFGLTSGGACGFGLYGLCTKGSTTASWTDPMLGSTCDAFCAAYPLLCKDPTGTTLRGNFAAPNGDYYTQFWPSLANSLDNYLSCGECMELIQTKADGTDYAVGETGYTDPIVLEVVDSCPCNANPKWCCGSGYDHCGEIDFKYGCPIPADSHHMDLSDIAMGRLQGNGSLSAGVIPIRYKRIPCPTPGNIYIWLRDGGGPYYFALSVVNTAGIGAVTKVEIQGYGTTTWTALIHDPNYTESRPQERYGSWTFPQGAGPFNLPVGLRVTSAAGEQVVNLDAIKTFNAPTGGVAGFNYLDLGVQFTK